MQYVPIYFCNTVKPAHVGTSIKLHSRDISPFDRHI